MAGRPTIPNAIKALKGTLRAVRVNPLEPVPEGDLALPPDHLSPGAKLAWEHAIRSAPPNLLKNLDLTVLEVWACAADLHRQAQVGLARTGLLVKAANGVAVQSPFLGIAHKQAQILAKTGSDMGFTPASRSKVSVQQTAQNAADDWNSFVC